MGVGIPDVDLNTVKADDVEKRNGVAQIIAREVYRNRAGTICTDL